MFAPFTRFYAWVYAHVSMRLIAIIGCLLLGAYVPLKTFAAASDYSGTIISISAPSRLEVGKTSTVTLTIKNTGIAIWKSSGANYTSLYRWDPVRKIELISPFAVSAWKTSKQPLALTQDVKPGESVTFSYPIQAPAVAGVYKEPFILTAEDAAWIKQTAFVLDFEVTKSANTGVSAPIAAPSVSVPVPANVSSPTVNNTEWSAELVDRGGSEWQIEAEDRVTIEIAFKNTGSRTWTREGGAFVSLYAVDATMQKERASAFKDARWPSATKAAVLRESSVRTGEVGHFRFDLRAPKTPGSYKESFMLAAENAAWISGTRLVLPITVPGRGEFVSTAPPAEAVALPSSSTPVASSPSRPAGTYAALLLLQSVKSATLLGNGSQEFTVGFKNIGTSAWSSRGMTFASLEPAKTGKAYSVRDAAWLSATDLVSVSGVTKPGEIGFLTFRVKAPSLKGSYVVHLRLTADQGAVEGGDLQIPMTVTQNGYVEPDPIPTPSPTAPVSTPSSQPVYNAIPLTGDVSSLSDEPIIRVGLFKTTDDQMIIRAKHVPFVVSQNGTTVCRANLGESVTVRFDRINKVYMLSGGACSGQSSIPYILRAEDGISPLEVADAGRSDNTFRAQLELRYAPATDNIWVINSLPIEWYLKGIAETSNISPAEFQRTLLVAARTYAMYHVQRGTKHANEFYTVDATYDQVYRGYGSEVRNPNVVAAINATRGQIVTYAGKLAITPYYSRSDGRTRAWGEVWYGGSQYPWLVSVPVPWDQGKTLWGHGVGMSASGALAMANEGRSYTNILTYFYPGIELRRAYK